MTYKGVLEIEQMSERDVARKLLELGALEIRLLKFFDKRKANDGMTELHGTYLRYLDDDSEIDIYSLYSVVEGIGKNNDRYDDELKREHLMNDFQLVRDARRIITNQLPNRG